MEKSINSNDDSFYKNYVEINENNSYFNHIFKNYSSDIEENMKDLSPDNFNSQILKVEGIINNFVIEYSTQRIKKPIGNFSFDSTILNLLQGVVSNPYLDNFVSLCDIVLINLNDFLINENCKNFVNVPNSRLEIYFKDNKIDFRLKYDTDNIKSKGVIYKFINNGELSDEIKTKIHNLLNNSYENIFYDEIENNFNTFFNSLIKNKNVNIVDIEKSDIYLPFNKLSVFLNDNFKHIEQNLEGDYYLGFIYSLFYNLNMTTNVTVKDIENEYYNALDSDIKNDFTFDEEFYNNLKYEMELFNSSLKKNN